MSGKLTTSRPRDAQAWNAPLRSDTRRDKMQASTIFLIARGLSVWRQTRWPRKLTVEQGLLLARQKRDLQALIPRRHIARETVGDANSRTL